MKTVGVKRLKARLSEYLRTVKAGETVLVTERDEVVAELRPARRQALPPAGLTAALEMLAESGDITRAVAAMAGWRWRTSGLGLPAGTAAELLDELRRERADG
ncbi:MAG: hypothetical protein Q8Q14_13245 [Gemmatimonadales bacterium]|nr:hypothetical protein [Gemmatimonadales bacterium]